MIPIGLPSYEFVFIRLGYFIATLVWIIWGLRLVFSRKARAQLRGWWLPAFCILTGTGIYSLWSAYAFNRDFAAYKAEVQGKYHQVLVEGQRLGGIDMPAGTVLKLGVARQMEAFDRAEFPHQVLVGGVHTMRVERYLSIQTDENFRTTGFTPENIRLTGVGESRQSGWICDATVAIVFATYPDGRIKAFESCTAAAGNLIEGEPLPEGAGITSSQGQIYLDGGRGSDRWLIHLPEKSGLQIRGTRQQGGAVLLDADRMVVEQVPK